MHAVISNLQPPPAQRLAPSVFRSLFFFASYSLYGSCKSRSRKEHVLRKTLSMLVCFQQACRRAQFSSRLQRKKIKQSSRRRIIRVAPGSHILHKPCQSTCLPCLPLTPILACELAPGTSCAYVSPVGSRRGTHSEQLPPATVPNFPQFSSSASTAGVTLARVVWGERPRTPPKCLSQPMRMIFIRSRGTLW